MFLDLLSIIIPSIITIVCTFLPAILRKKQAKPNLRACENKGNSKKISVCFPVTNIKEETDAQVFSLGELTLQNIGEKFFWREVVVNDKHFSINQIVEFKDFCTLNIAQKNLKGDYYTVLDIKCLYLLVENDHHVQYAITLNFSKNTPMFYNFSIGEIYIERKYIKKMQVHH